jgi:hypothetical protein
MTSPLAKAKKKRPTPRGRWNPSILTHPRMPGKSGQRSTVLSARNMEANTPCITQRSANTTQRIGSSKNAGVCLNLKSQQMERMS